MQISHTSAGKFSKSPLNDAVAKGLISEDEAREFSSPPPQDKVTLSGCGCCGSTRPSSSCGSYRSSCGSTRPSYSCGSYRSSCGSYRSSCGSYRPSSSCGSSRPSSSCGSSRSSYSCGSYRPSYNCS